MGTTGIWLWVMLGVAISSSELRENVYDQPVPIPRCCPPLHALAPNRTCVPQPWLNFEPNVVINGEVMIATNIVGEVSDLACGDGEGTATYVSLQDDPGMLEMIEGAVDFMWLPPDRQQYCLAMEMTTDSSLLPNYVVMFCHKDAVGQFENDKVACADATCVRKCCPRGESLMSKMSCGPIDENEDWQPSFSTSVGPVAPALPPSDLLVVYGLPRCEPILIYDDHILLDTGKVSAAGQLFSQDEYCIENNNESESQEVQELALICLREETSTSDFDCPWKHVVVSALMSISCVFLAITWIIYVSVPLLRSRNMGRCILSFISAMFVSFLTLIIITRHREGFSTAQCSITATVSHLSILATFFWINVMSFHIFSHLKLPHSDHREGVRLFLLYNLYAWGSSLLVTLIGLILDLTQADFVRPHFELPNCWFIDQASRWVYQYGILLVLIIINIGFFVWSVVLLRQRQRSGSQAHTVCVSVYLRLFIITGVLWITEVLTWQASNQCGIAVVVLDIINSLQGVYIFLVSVCFRRDLKVFHCGWPQLATDTGGHVASDTGEVTELMGAPPRKD